MKSTRSFSLVLFACLGMLLTAPVQADLVLQITGTPGSGSTTWAFSGSDIAGGSGQFSAASQIVNGVWQDLGDFTDLNVFDVPGDGGMIEGSALITIGTNSQAIDSVLIDDDGGLGDDLAVGVAGSDFLFSTGDLVSWSGTLTVTGIDLTDIDNTPLPATLTSSTYGTIGVGEKGILNLRVTIGIPEPGMFAVVAVGSMVIAGIRRRRR